MSELKHYGIPGQKWGIRRWQNDDGSFNEEGKKRYGRIGKGIRNANQRRLRSAYNASMEDAADLRKHGYKKEAKAVEKVARNLKDYLDNYSKSGSVLTPKQKQVLKAGVIAVASGLAVIGVSKVIENRVIKQQNIRDAAGRRFMEFQNESAKRAWDEINAKIEKAEKAKVTAEANIVDRHAEAAKAIGKMVRDIQSDTPRSINTKTAEMLNDINKKLTAVDEAIDNAKGVNTSSVKLLPSTSSATRYGFNPEKYDPKNIVRSKIGRLDEKADKLLNAISNITYPVGSHAYDEAVKRAARNTGNTIWDAERMAYQYRNAVKESQTHPSSGEIVFSQTINNLKTSLDRLVDEFPRK